MARLEVSITLPAGAAQTRDPWSILTGLTNWSLNDGFGTGNDYLEAVGSEVAIRKAAAELGASKEDIDTAIADAKESWKARRNSA